ncbi:MAG: M55 family metallopeptidase [Planctomycetota bacterium]
MKIYIHTDIEGVAGMVHFEDRNDTSVWNYHHRKRMHALLTGEVNAAIEGALAAGATEILVNDSHGSGYSIIFEELNPAAQIIHGPLTRQPFWMPCFDKSIHALICVAQHAMAGTNGVLAHSAWDVNGIQFGEAGMAMAIAGYYDVPCVFCSGDNVATAQVKALVPQMATVAVKEALSPYNAKSWTPQRAREMIREGVKKGLERRRDIPPFKIAPPYKIGHPPAPGKPPTSVLEGDDFIAVVKQRLCQTYHYDLQDLPNWPMEPGHHQPALPKSLLKKWLEEQKQAT